MENKDLYTIQEVADLLKVGPPTVKKYIKDGKIKAVRLSIRTIRILRAEIAYLLPKTEETK